MTFRPARRGVFSLGEARLREPGEVEATLVVTGRTGDGCSAGVALYYDENNFWHLALVEAPAAEGGRRFVELNEAYGGFGRQISGRYETQTTGRQPQLAWNITARTGYV